MDLNEALSQVADIIYKKYDPCEMGKYKCLAGNYQCCHTTTVYDGPCPHLDVDTGCTQPNIKCKTGFCPTALANMSDECLKSFAALEEIALLQGIEMRLPHLKDLKRLTL